MKKVSWFAVTIYLTTCIFGGIAMYDLGKSHADRWWQERERLHAKTFSEYLNEVIPDPKGPCRVQITTPDFVKAYTIDSCTGREHPVSDSKTPSLWMSRPRRRELTTKSLPPGR